MFLLADTPVGPLPMPIQMDAGLGGVWGPVFTLIMMAVSGYFSLRGNATVAELRAELVAAKLEREAATRAAAETKLAAEAAVKELAATRKELDETREEMRVIRDKLAESESDRTDMRRQLADCQQERVELARLRKMIEEQAVRAGRQ